MDRKLKGLDLPSLEILKYPDPRLREVCTPVKAFDQNLRALAERMLELMFAAKGVGLAAPQVGVSICLFVSSPTFEPQDRRIYVNPRILRSDGEQEGEEGCLSFPGIACNIKRHNIVAIEALNPDGERFEETSEGLAARIFQHELDHLDGRLLVDRMGSVARLSNRRMLKELEERFNMV